MANFLFYDDNAVIALGEAILSQLQLDYMGAYIRYLTDGPNACVTAYGKGRRKSAKDLLKEMDDYIRSSTLTAEHAESIIEELRRQGREAVAKGTTAKKVNMRKYEEPRAPYNYKTNRKKKGDTNEDKQTPDSGNSSRSRSRIECSPCISGGAQV